MEDVFAQYSEALAKGHQAAIDGRPRDALASYREAVRLAPERPLPHVCIGGVLLRTGQLSEATAAYERALELAPEDAGALSGKAAALHASGRPDEAAAVLARLDEVDRSQADRRREQADAEAMRELERSGTLPQSEKLYVVGERAWAAGRADAAIDAWLGSARGYAKAGQLDAALDSCLRALLVAPGAPAIHLELARLYLVRGWIDRAAERLTLLDRLLALAPDPDLETALRALAREHASRHESLAVLASAPPHHA